jgi:hypothetical protein
MTAPIQGVLGLSTFLVLALLLCAMMAQAQPADKGAQPADKGGKGGMRGSQEGMGPMEMR